MARLSSILRSIEDGGLGWWCPGCDGMHAIYHGHGPGPRWTWNGDVEKPTFSPSVLVRGMKPLTPEQHAHWLATRELPEPTPRICHSYVIDGRMQFLGDCTHALANQTVDIPSFDDEQDT